jgi:hypothetical protein
MLMMMDLGSTEFLLISIYAQAAVSPIGWIEINLTLLRPDRLLFPVAAFIKSSGATPCVIYDKRL